MQDLRFDDLTRTLAKATSRRQLLKGLLAGLAGAAVAQHGGSAAAGCDVAQCKADADSLYQEEYQACKQDGSKGAGFCTLWALMQRHFNDKKCDRSGCFDGTCCNGQCTSLYTDSQNCGRCGHACPSGGGCSGGRCHCPDDLTFCNDQCIDTQFDHDNCGECGNACTGCQTCLSGQCVDACGENATCCNGQCVGTDCQAPKIYDPSQCSCVCPFGGECGDTCCTGGTECCDGACYDHCSAGQKRDPGTCQCVCSTGETCGPYCCDGSKACCPDALSGMACRDQDPNCPDCQYTCGDLCCDQSLYCCRSADYSFHCVASSGDSC